MTENLPATLQAIKGQPLTITNFSINFVHLESGAMMTCIGVAVNGRHTVLHGAKRCLELRSTKAFVKPMGGHNSGFSLYNYYEEIPQLTMETKEIRSIESYNTPQLKVSQLWVDIKEEDARAEADAEMDAINERIHADNLKKATDAIEEYLKIGIVQSIHYCENRAKKEANYKADKEWMGKRWAARRFSTELSRITWKMNLREKYMAEQEDKIRLDAVKAANKEFKLNIKNHMGYILDADRAGLDCKAYYELCKTEITLPLKNCEAIPVIEPEEDEED